MAVAKKLFVGAELEWAEKQLCEWKDYVDAHPLISLQDRVGQKTTAKGGMIPYVISSIEQQGKFLQETMKMYLNLLKEVDLMRSLEEEKKIKARGVESLSPMEDGSI
jgi:hypothetical protein